MAEERTANLIDKKVGARVRERRLQIGMSQEHLAALLGITFQQVQKYEKGVNRIAASRLFAIAAALDVPIAAFFEGLKAPVKGHAVEDVSMADKAMATPEGAALVRLIASVASARKRRQLLAAAIEIAGDSAKR